MKIIATIGFWAIPIATLAGSVCETSMGGVSGGFAVGVAVSLLCLLTLVTIDIWKS